MLKNKYRISLWEDYLVPETTTVPEHYEEREICIIGSDTMTSQARAVEPKLVQNINGTNTLTFKIYYSYTDNETGEKVRNPYISFLVNERKVKCHWNGKWYDFVVKGIQEDSNGKSITYTCSDIFVNELSKTGFNLEFDDELNNNQGSAQELGQKILEGTDWKLDLTNSDHILQTIEEPLYKATVKKAFTAESKSIPANSTIYIFYSIIQEKETYFQFIYNENYETETNSQLLKENNCYSIEISNFDSWTSEYLTITSGELSDYRGKRLVRQQLQKFNEAVGRYCYVFKDTTNPEILGFSTVEYKDPTTVLNIISNSKEFVDTNGWQGPITWNLYPPFYDTELTEAYESTTYLRVGASTIFNSGLQTSSIYLEDGLQRGQRYFLRVKAFTEQNEAPTSTLIAKDKVGFAIYDYFNSLSSDNSIPVHNTTSYCDVKSSTIEDGWIQLEIECNNSIPREQLTAGYLMAYENEDPDSTLKERIAKPGIFISFGVPCWIQEVQFYQRIEGYNGKIIHLGDMDTQSVGTTYYKYFIPNDSYKDENDIKYLYCGTEKQNYEKVYEGTDANYVKYEKIRSIQAKNSNRFNLLQSIAETFECWVRFDVQHDENTGRIIYKNGFPQKIVYFKEKVGKELGYGFVYGIDLKTISRSIDSNQIASKVIVSPNINEYAKDGICEIAKSEFSETGENYILNFDYYISQGLLNGGELNKYLYLSSADGLGFYPALKANNSAYNARAIEISAKKTELVKQNSLKTVYDQYVSSASEQISSLKSQLAFLAGLTEYDFKKVAQYLQDHPDNTNVKNLFTTLATVEHNKESYEKTLEKLETSVANLTSYITELEDKNDELLKAKKVLEENFYKKFSRFIQEGSWTSQDYLDENLYYLDARGVAYTSSRPKISYNISAIRLNALPEFQGKVFEVGDISFIEDIDFFGYVNGQNGWKTPYKEQVLISEKSTYFDSPEKDSFVIQNYKTQFEDLFQRITATTQSLQYSSGEYQRAADVIDNNGIINGETLQNSIATNNQLVFASQNEEIFQDSTGLTLSDKNDPSKKTKLTSGGLFISTDGGVTWKNAVRGEGIATQYLTAGAINVNNISIYDGNNPTFRWDQYGLSAYAVSRDEKGNLLGVNPQTFVRFDHFGVYGINGTEDEKDFVPQAESEIKQKAKFGMTWSGFFLKNNEGDGLIEISTENDILITKNSQERVKIGRLGNNLFGIRFQDDDGNVSLETDDLGRLWLKDRLNISGEAFVLTNDTSPEEDKPYYSLIDGTYTQVSVDSTQNPKELGYYEKSRYNVGVGNLGKDETERNQVINANNRFIVYEDGSMVATNGTFSGDISGSTGTFTGRIEATNGRIGGLEISASSITGEPFATLTEDSLTLKNGSFTILDSEGNPSFYTDENGDLTFSGNLNGAKGTFSGDLEACGGTFSGDISASTGTFTGGIMASSGTIGGFVIGPDELTSIGTTTIDDEESANIILNGRDGRIYARNIELGEGATIETSITLGQAKIWNPAQEPHNYFLQVGDNVYLTEDGKMSFGSIDIDGSTNNPTIEGHENGITYWKINKDSAIFKDITASGGTIENVVFKKSTIQSSSGAMIFKPSAFGWYEELDGKYCFFFKDTTDASFFEIGDRVLLSGSTKADLGDGKTESLTVEATIQGVGASGSHYCELDVPAVSCNTIIKLYSYKDNVLSDDLLIGVNSNSITSGSLNIDKFLFREGFTFTSPVVENGKAIYPAMPKLFMGNLASIGKQGYGLYADNVYLNGTVTTIVPSDNRKTFAGINTISGFSLADSSEDKIVFWAGASGEDEVDVQASPFIVTDTGKLFASDGHFSRSVFVESEIRGTDIYTARLHGTGNEKSYSARTPALIIYNTSENSNGIEFRTEKLTTEDPTIERGLFRICGDAFEAIKVDAGGTESSNSFIKIDNGSVDFLGNSFEGNGFKTTVKNNERIEISNYSLSRKALTDEGIFSVKTEVALGSQSIVFNVGENTVLEAKENLIEIPKDLSVNRNITYGDGGVVMEYKRVDGGYDLYIHEEEISGESTVAIADLAIADVSIVA